LSFPDRTNNRDLGGSSDPTTISPDVDNEELNPKAIELLIFAVTVSQDLYPMEVKLYPSVGDDRELYPIDTFPTPFILFKANGPIATL
jgi:hypothetical protein